MDAFTGVELKMLKHVQDSLGSCSNTLEVLGLRDHQESQTQWRASADLIAKLLYLILGRVEHLGEKH